MTKARYNVADFEPHIAGSGGIISTIAKRVGCDWSTARRHIDESPTLKRLYDDECEGVLDMAESVILRNIKDGDTADAKWYLSRKGKGRGYADKSEIEHTGKDGGPVETRTTHAIDSDAAGTIFDILAEVGAISAISDDAEDDALHTA